MPDIIIKGKKIRLTDKDFLAQGGEGEVYRKNNTAFKIYNDPKKMIPIGKIQELSSITDPNVIKPQEVIFNSKNNPIGYTMRYLADTYALCQLFTKAFKKKNGLKPKQALSLIQSMRESVDHVHDKNILIVDLNEMNFMVNSKFDEVYFIDVDSYQTPNFHATALMESVRDRHGKLNVFTKETDWFSFAVVTFHLMSGIHPYKGRHPKYKGFEDRMSHNISVFNPDVKLPAAVSDYDKLIPPALKDWYKKVFEDGLRTAPPLDFVNDAVDQVFVVQTVVGTNNFIIDVYKSFDEEVINYRHFMGSEAFITETKAYFQHLSINCDHDSGIGFNNGIPFVVNLKNDHLNINQFSSQSKNTFDAQDYMIYDDRVYFKNFSDIYELIFIGDKPVQQVVGKTMENATKMFPGVSIQNMLGKFVASVFPSSKLCYQISIDQLKDYKIVEAKYENGILVIIGIKKGKYDRFIFSIETGKIISERKVEDITNTGINFIALDKGIAVLINEEDKVEVFAKSNVNKIKIIEDSQINGNMKLFAKGSQVLFTGGNKIYTLTMK